MKDEKRAFWSLDFLQAEIRRCRLRLIKTEEDNQRKQDAKIYCSGRRV